MKRAKIRYETWYWGNYVLEGDEGFSLKEKGFELYDEEKHGWHHSEEFKKGRLTPYHAKAVKV